MVLRLKTMRSTWWMADMGRDASVRAKSGSQSQALNPISTSSWLFCRFPTHQLIYLMCP